MEATHSSETSVSNKATRRHMPEDGILHSHCRENLKSHIFLIDFIFNLVAHSITKERLISLDAHVSDILISASVTGDSNIKQEFGKN
jgi:hypothetical protein